MRKRPFCLYIVCFAAFLLCFSVGSIVSSAAETSTTKSYEVADVFIFGDGEATTYKYTMDFGENPNSAGYYNKLLINSTVPVVFYYNENGNLCMMMAEAGKERDLSYWTDINGNNLGSAAGTDALAKYGAKVFTWGSSYLQSLFVSSSDNCLIFENETYARNYIETGDTAGLIRDIDWSSVHDFGADRYSLDIPVPEISQASHEGFTLSNWSEDYYLDIIVESHLNGVKVKNAVVDTVTGNHYYNEYDPDWIYASHYFNFTLSNVAVSQSDINIKDVYGVDNVALLTDDFKKWSVEYPKVQKLPSWNFLMWNYELSRCYQQDNVYDYDSQASDLTQLNCSGQAVTTYYVRYYTKDIKYGQWIKYSVRPSYFAMGNALNGVIDVSSVDVDLEGNVSLSNETSGVIDSDGNISYLSPSDSNLQMSNIDLNASMSDFWGMLKGLYNGMNQFPGIIRDLFGYLPVWCTSFMGLSLMLVIFLRLLGR